MAGDRLKVAALQMAHGPCLRENLATAGRLVAQARERNVDLCVLPEYFFAHFPDPPGDAEEVRAFLAEASRGVAVAANVIEGPPGRLKNVGVLFHDGRCLLEQEKLHPMPREVAAGVAGGTRLAAAPFGGHLVGLLVCADILFPEAALLLALQHTDLLLNPVLSPYRPDDPSRAAREALYVARAWDAAAFVVKAGGYRQGPDGIAGRSLVAAPWGMLAHYRDEFAEEVLTAELDFTKLAAFRRDKERFPPRRPELYGALAEGR
ncbi:MAG: carbon-nitrogen hydrolase family protein [Thermoplasmatota archaeon]